LLIEIALYYSGYQEIGENEEPGKRRVDGNVEIVSNLQNVRQ